MKIDLDTRNHMLSLTSEDTEDSYLIGRLAVRLKDRAQVYPVNNKQREMRADFEAFIRLAANGQL